MIVYGKYSTGKKVCGGSEYEELVVRDARGMIVGYALLDPREETYRHERQSAIQEFEQDFGK